MQVKINGILANLGDSYPAITKKSIDPNDPSSRFIDFTNQFQLPDTNTNRKIFDSPGGVGTNNRSFDKLYDVEISDIFRIFKGKGFLSNSDKSSFSLQVVDDSKDLFNALDIKLSSLFWDDKDTALTTAQIDALDSEDSDNCWFWGKACLHKDALKINTDQTTGDARCKYSRPSFYVTGLLNRAIQNAGYTMLIPTKNLAFTACHSDFFFTSYQKTLNTTYSPSGTLTLSGLDTNDFSHSDLTVTSTNINIGTKNLKFRLRGTVTATAAINIIIRATDASDATKITETSLALEIGEQIIDFSTSDLQSDNTFDVQIIFSGTGNVIFDNCLLYTIHSDKNDDLSTNPFLNYKIKAYDNLPDLTYLDLFKLICVIYNKYQIVDTFEKILSFGTMANLSKMNSKDWSRKFIQRSETISQSFEGLAKKNYLEYTNDSTVNKKLGWDYFETDNESLQDEIDYLVLNFGASNDVTINSNSIAQVSVYNNTSRITDREIFIRLFEINGSLLQFTPINWTNLIANYYSNWFNCLYRIRTIECEANLNKYDILTWSEDDIVYIEYFKSSFIVLEISNFIPGQKTKIKLLNYGR